MGIVVLSACTAVNPAFEDDGGSSGSASAADAPGSSSPGEPTTGETSNPVTEGTVTSSVGTGETDTSEPTTGEDTAETGLEDPPPPKIGPYGPPVRLLINDPFQEDDDPTLTEDQLELYFASYRFGSLGNDDIWVARRTTTDHDWDMPVPVTELNSMERENTPEVSLDGRVMFFSSTRDSFRGEDVFVSTRRDRASAWSAPVPVDEINTMTRDVCPFVLPQGREMFACTGQTEVLDLVRFERDEPSGTWSGPFALPELNDPSFLDCGAWVDAGARVVMFFSDRPGGMDRTDLWVASRETSTEPFGAPTPIQELNSLWSDDDPWVSQTGDVVYFASDRGGEPAQDIYMALRIE